MRTENTTLRGPSILFKERRDYILWIIIVVNEIKEEALSAYKEKISFELKIAS